jgi:hypothetical protein
MRVPPGYNGWSPPVYFAETFVDPTRHRGTCCRAANWVLMGRTMGLGKGDPTKRPNRTIKDVLGLQLIEDLGERLPSVRAKNHHTRRALNGYLEPRAMPGLAKDSLPSARLADRPHLAAAGLQHYVDMTKTCGCVCQQPAALQRWL